MITFSILGKITLSSASFTIIGVDVLLISCDVSPKCMNSLCSERSLASNCSFIKYSTALTSWLVTASIDFILSASAVEKFSIIDLTDNLSSSVRLLSWGTVSLNLRKYSISTNTRYLMRASSEKYCESGCVFLAYRPSIGEMACNMMMAVY